MSNIDAVNALISAINLDRFAEIEARHAPDVTFWSFRGPTLHTSVAVQDWHTRFLRDYADCNYTDLEYIEQDNTVVVRATIEAKGYDWRPFTQRVVEVFHIDDDGSVAERRMYAMLPNLELEKAPTAAMTSATGFKGGSVSATKAAVEAFHSGDPEAAVAALDEKAALIDTVYGTTVGPQNILDLIGRIPRPAFGSWRVISAYHGPKDACVELAIDPNRPRQAQWLRIVEGKIMVVETYWMLREIGVSLQNPERHQRQVILPI
jgi:hypothetical protein